MIEEVQAPPPILHDERGLDDYIDLDSEEIKSSDGSIFIPAPERIREVSGGVRRRDAKFTSK